MIKVNLLPKLLVTGPVDYPLALVAGAAVFVIGLGVTGFLYRGNADRITQAEASLAAVKERYERERGEVESADKAKEELRYIEEKENWILSQTGTQREWGTYLQEIKDQTPQDLWLTDMEADNTKQSVKLKGRAYTLGSIAHMMVKYDLINSISMLRVDKVAKSMTLIEQNQKAIEEAQERRKNTGENVTVPEELPQLGFAAQIFEPVDFEVTGNFKIEAPTTASPALSASAAPAGAPPPPPGGGG